MYFKKDLVKGSIIVVLPNRKILYSGKKLLRKNFKRVLWDAETIIKCYYPKLNDSAIDSIVKNSSIYKYTGKKVKLIKKAKNPKVSRLAKYILHQPLRKIEVFG